MTTENGENAAALPDTGDDEAKLWAELEQAEAKSEAPPEDGRAADAEPPQSGQPKEESGADNAPAPAHKAEADNGEPKAPSDDIWAKAPPEAKAAYDAAIARSKALEHDVSSNRGRVSALTRQLDEIRKGGGNQPASAVALKDDPDFKAFEKEYPEVAGPVAKLLDKMVSPLAGQLAGISEERRSQYLAEQHNVVISQHGDYDSVTKSQDFYRWYEQAPPYIKAGVERNAQFIIDGSEVAHIVKMFKAETGFGQTQNPPNPGTQKPAAQADKRKMQLESSAAPAARGQAKVSQDVPDDPEEAWKYYERMDQQKAAANR